MEQQNMDRLSELHNSLKIHILCFLEMKDIVKTGILSKRWKNLWTQVYDIVYKCNILEPHRLSSINWSLRKQLEHNLSFIDNTLMQCVSNVRKFSLSGFDSFSDLTLSDKYKKSLKCIDKWVEFVCKKKVEIINLNTRGLGYYIAPGFLFMCSSLTQLELSCMDLRLSTTVKWRMLRSLSLDSIYKPLGADGLDNILFGCPVLEILVLKRVFPVRIVSSSLKKLKLVDICHFFSIAYHVLEIRTPLLQELEILGSFTVRNLVIADVPSLVKGTLDFRIYDKRTADMLDKDEWFHMVVELVRSLCQAGELLIGSQILQALSLSSLLGKPCSTFMCKHLEINSPLWNYDIFGIVYLLDGMPHLETLTINVSRCLVPAPLNQIQNQVFSQLSFRNGRLMHLKNITIDYHLNPYNDVFFADKIGKKCVDFELVGYILRSCVVLEKLVIRSTKPYSCYEKAKCWLKSCCAFRYLHQFSSKLLMELLPANKDSQWELKKNEFTFEFSFPNYTSMRFDDCIAVN